MRQLLHLIFSLVPVKALLLNLEVNEDFFNNLLFPLVSFSHQVLYQFNRCFSPDIKLIQKPAIQILRTCPSCKQLKTDLTIEVLSCSKLGYWLHIQLLN